MQGDKSKQQKEDLMVNLIRGLNSIEGKYIIRFLNGNLKIGAAEKIFQISLARAFCQYFNKEKSFFQDSIDYKEFSEMEIEQKFQFFEQEFQLILTQFPNIGNLITSLLSIRNLHLTKKQCQLQLGTPCKPMLAKPTKSI